MFDGKGEPLADIAYTSYELDGADRATRPVTFLFNGGPGASSAWLQFGAAGPWRLPLDGEVLSPSASPEVKPNAETWLDFTDLVFIDPVSTGYSRFVAAEFADVETAGEPAAHGLVDAGELGDLVGKAIGGLLVRLALDEVGQEFAPRVSLDVGEIGALDRLLWLRAPPPHSSAASRHIAGGWCR